MSGRSSRGKGQTGEREFFKLSNDALKEVDYPFRHKDGDIFKRHPAPRHGHGQPDNTDPMGVLPVTIEVKRVEKPQFKLWIDKLQEQSRETQTPVLAWRQNGKPWTIMPLLNEQQWGEFLRWKFRQENKDGTTD